MFGKQKLQFNIAYQHTARTTLATFGLVVLVCAYVISFGLFAGPVQPVEAAIPKYINFQGKLTAVSNGNNVANGSYSFEFKLYAASSGGSPLWTETWDGSPAQCPQLAVANGVFNAKLGACEPLTSVDFTTGSLYLTVNFNPGAGFDGEMSPRKQLVSSAYAFVANSVSGDGVVNNAIQSATALSTGRTLANPALQVDTNTASSVTGLKVTAAAAGGGLALAAISSGTDENLTIDAKGAGTISIGSSSTGNILFGGGSASTGCTVTNSTGAFACTSAISSGVAGGTIGGYNLSGNTSGTISILPQAAAGTYNFNLPTTAGTSGYVLTSGGGGATAMTWTDPSGLGVRWNAIINPTGTQSLTFDDGELNAWTVSSDTETFQTITANSLTTGTLLSASSSSLSSGSLVNLAVSGTAAASNTQKVLNISTSGANGTSTQTTYGGYFSNTHTGTSSTNVAGYFTASGGTNNYAIIVPASGGNVGIGTSTPTNLSGSYFGGDQLNPLWVSANDAAKVTALVIQGNLGEAVQFVDQSGTAEADFGVYTTDLYFVNRQGSGNIRFDTNGSTSMFVSSTQRVGIGSGTSAPAAKLEVKGTTGQLSTLIGDAGYGTSYAGLSVHGTLAAGSYSLLGDATNLYINRPTGGDISIRENNSTQVTIKTSTGNFGIGDSSPAALLTVGSGDLYQVNSSGNLIFNQTSPTVSIGNTGSLVFNDGTNTLCTIADAGTTGNLTCTGNITGASTGTVGYWSRSGTTVSPATSGDTLSVPGTGTNSQKFGSGTTSSATETLAVGYNASASADYGTAVGAASSAGQQSTSLGRNANGGFVNSVSIGYNSTAGGNQGIAIGSAAAATGSSIAIGYNSAASGTIAMAIGESSSASGTFSTAIGYQATANFGNSTAIGLQSAATAAGQFVAGSTNAPISNVYFANGVVNTSPTAYIINGTGGSGTNIAGADIILGAGKGTGNAQSGDILFQTSTAGSSGTTLQTLATRMAIDGATGYVGIGTTSPTSKLVISGGSGNGNIYNDVSGVNPTLILAGDTTNGYYPGIDFRPNDSTSAGGMLQSYSSSGGLYFTLRGNAGALRSYNSTNTTTNSIVDQFISSSNSTGTAAANFGTGILLQGESSTTNDQDMARIATYWTTATHATRTSNIGFYTVNSAAALAEKMTIQGDGNVGIGTTGPTRTLTVVKQDNGTEPIVAAFANNLTQGIGITYNTISAIGSNTNQNISLVPKGTGDIIINSGRTGVAYTPTSGTAVLMVNGGAAIGSSTYLDATVPTNGLIVQGSVGIGNTSPSALLTLGTAGTTAGTLSMAGSTSGVITIQPQAVAGTYNFNLPTTAGTSGYVLTSAGGGVSPMTWTDPSGLGVRWNALIAPTGNLSLAHGANTTAFTFNSVTTGTAMDFSSTSLTTGKLLQLTPGTSLTTGSALGITGATYNPGAGNSGNLLSLAFTNASSNTTGVSNVAGISIAPTISVAGSGGTQNTYGINIQNAAGTVGAGVQNIYGVYIGNQGRTNADFSYGLYVASQSGSNVNYAAGFAGDVEVAGVFTAASGGGPVLSVNNNDFQATGSSTSKLYLNVNAGKSQLGDVENNGNAVKMSIDDLNSVIEFNDYYSGNGFGGYIDKANSFLAWGDNNSNQTRITIDDATQYIALGPAASPNIGLRTTDSSFPITFGEAFGPSVDSTYSIGSSVKKFHIIYGNGLSLGTAATATGNIELSGSTSGTVTIRPQDAAGSYNFLLPTTAGTSGHLLTSGGGASPMTWTDPAGLGVRWNALVAPTGNLSLAHGANTTAFTFNSVTTGNAFGLSSSSLSSGTLFNLAVTGTAAASNTQKVLNITTSGANATSSQTTYGGYFSNTHTGTSSTNISLYSAASGGTTNKTLELDVSGGTDTVGIEIDSANSAPGTSNHTGIDVDARNFYGTTTTIRGINISAGPQSSSGGSTTVTGLQLQVGSLNNGGTVSTAYGIDASLTANNSASITTGSIIRAYAADIGAATYGTLYGLNLSNWSGLSATTTYGIYMDTSIDQGSTRYALYSSATSSSYMAGNLGLGDTSPAALLTVGNGDLFQVASNGNLTSSNAGTWTFSNDTNIALSGGVNGLSFDTDVLSIDATNNRVGIGLTAPLATFHVYDTIQVGSNGASNGFIRSPNNLGFTLDTDNDQSNNYYSFEVHAATIGTGTELMRIQENGNVGIGTTGPDRKLDILDASNPQMRLTHTDGSVYTDFQTDSSGYLNMTSTGHRVRVVDNYNGVNNFQVLNSTTGTSASSNVIVGQSTAGDQIFQMTYANTTNSVYGADLGLLTTGTGATGGMLISTQANASITLATNGLSNPRLTVLGSGNVGIGDATPASLFTVGSGDLLQVNTFGDMFGNQTTLDGSTTANGAGTSSNTLILTSATNFNIGNYVKVDPTGSNTCSGSVTVCYAKITNISSNTLTISPALTWDNGASVVEVHVPEIGGINLSEPLANRYGRGYFIDGIVTGNGSTYFSDNRINVTTGNFAITGGNVGIGDTSPAALFTVGSGDLLQINSSGLVLAPNGSASNPAFSFVAAPTSGIFYTPGVLGSPNMVSTAVDGTEFLRIQNDNVVEMPQSQAYFVMQSGDICIGRSAICPTTSPGGNGTVYSHSLDTGNVDVAENYPSKDTTLQAGEVVMIDSEFSEYIERSSLGMSDKVIGVISTKPGLTLGGIMQDSQYGNDKKYPVALVGRVPVKVTNENGAIQPGDFLTASTTIPGAAMRATKSGAVIGQALEGYSVGNNSTVSVGSIITFIKPTDFNGVAIEDQLPGLEFDYTDVYETAETSEQILEYLLAQLPSLDYENLSVVNTDILIAGAEVFSPNVTTQTLRTDFLSSATSDGGLSVASTTMFNGGLTVDTISAIGDLLSFSSDVEFFGTPYFTSDTAGFAVVKAGVQSVDVVFSREYLAQPIVNASISFEQDVDQDLLDEEAREVLKNDSIAAAQTFLAEGITYVVTNKSKFGFTIVLSKPASSDVKMSWTALAVRNATTFMSIDTPSGFVAGVGDGGGGSGDGGTPPASDPPADVSSGDTPPSGDTPSGDGGGEGSGTTP